MAEALAGDANARVWRYAKAFGAILEVEEEEVTGEALVDGGVVDKGFGKAAEEISG